MKTMFTLLKGMVTLVMILSAGYALTAQTCEPVSDIFNLGGTSHDDGFQNINSTYSTTVLNDGSFVVTWETRDDVDGDDTGGFFQIFNEEGSAITDVIVPYADYNPSGTGRQGSFGPMVVALNSGFVIAWTSRDGPGDTGPVGDEQQDIIFRVYSNLGNPVSASTRLSVPGEEDKLNGILPLSTGGFVILFHIDEDNTGNNDDYFIATYDANGMSTSPQVNISGGAHDDAFQTVSSNQSMVDLGSGKFAVAWESRDDIDGNGNGGFIRIFNADGTPVSPVIMPYADINSGGTGDQATPGPLLTLLENGNFVVSWESEGGPGDLGTIEVEQDIYFRVYNDDGNPVSNTLKANSDNTAIEAEMVNVVALTGGNFAVLYHRQEENPGNNKDDYFVRTFSPNGIAAGASLEISDGTHLEAFCTVDNNGHGMVPLSNGNFAVGWAARDAADGDQSGIYYRVFNTQGAAVSGVILPYADINPTGQGDQSPFGPKLEALPSGFAIAWISELGPGDVGPPEDDQKVDTYHRIIDNNGMPLCGTAKTNAGSEAEEERLMALQGLENGNLAVVFKDDEDDTGNKDDFFVRVVGGTSLQTVCPTLNSISLSSSSICLGQTFDVTVTGLQNMAMSDNNDQNYGLSFVAFTNQTTNPYSGGTNLGTISFSNLGGGGATASIQNVNIMNADADLYIYAILNASPDDATCAPFLQATIAINENPVVSLVGLPDLCEDTGVQSNLGGGTPVGGTYTGPGVTDDGNGMTYSFNPAAAGVGVHSITYSYTSAAGCSGSDAKQLEVFALPMVSLPAQDVQCVNDPTQNGLGGGTPEGGIYSGPGVMDDGNGETFTFDPATAGVGVHTITYSYSSAAGCSSSGSNTIEVFDLPAVSLDLADTLLMTQASPLTGLGGGFPLGGTYTSNFPDEMMDDGNGETFSFTDQIFIGDFIQIIYTYTDANGCSNTATHNVFIGDSTTSTDELEELPFKIYPNPTTGLISLQDIEADEIKVYDRIGRLVNSFSNPGNTIDLTDQIPGMYILIIQADEKHYAAKIIKE